MPARTLGSSRDVATTMRRGGSCGTGEPSWRLEIAVREGGRVRETPLAHAPVFCKSHAALVQRSVPSAL